MLLPEDEDCPISLAALEFSALARNAFDVMMRREWFPIPGVDGLWRVASKTVMDSPYDDGPGLEPCDQPECHDPFTALVEADKWYAEHVEKRPT